MNTAVGRHDLLQGIFPTQGSNPSLLHCGHILYHLSHQGSPRILEWVAISFSRGFSQPRDQIHISCVSCIAGRFFTHWAIGKDLCWKVLYAFSYRKSWKWVSTHKHTYTHIYLSLCYTFTLLIKNCLWEAFVTLLTLFKMNWRLCFLSTKCLPFSYFMYI